MACELVQTLFSATPKKNGKKRSGHARLGAYHHLAVYFAILAWIFVEILQEALLSPQRFLQLHCVHSTLVSPSLADQTE